MVTPLKGCLIETRLYILVYIYICTLSSWWFQTFLVFHFIYGIIYPSHWRTPSFFKMFFNHEAVMLWYIHHISLITNIRAVRIQDSLDSTVLGFRVFHGENQPPSLWLWLTVRHGKSPFLRTVNHLLIAWWFSMAMLVITRGQLYSNKRFFVAYCCVSNSKFKSTGFDSLVHIGKLVSTRHIGVFFLAHLEGHPVYR